MDFGTCRQQCMFWRQVPGFIDLFVNEKSMIENNIKLERGELYLFHDSDIACDPDSSLWGMFDRIESDKIFLESSTSDLRNFRRWHTLPESMRYCRLSTRNELRDYIANMIISEARVF